MQSSDVAKPPHNRKLGLCGVSLTKARLHRENERATNQVRDEIEFIIVDSGFIEGAPFSWVTIAIRYGLKNEQEPHYQRVNKKYGDLPLAIEVDTHDMLSASFDTLLQVYRRAVLLALIHAGNKYQRPVDQLEAELQACN